ncbi:glutamate mutase L [Streptomyces xanthophaeus]|uniref:glutamate mutase L n=1 Tax=Streptomyces xanthophaeus TaxID=67385 RepID=UPI0034481DF3
MSVGATWLADAGSAEIKLCRTGPDGRPGAVLRLARRAGTSPGEQLRALLEQRGFDPATDRLRLCSSARGGLRIGLLGLTGGFSLPAAARAATLAGAVVGYAHRMDEPPQRPCPEVDVLVAVGGVDGGDPRHLRAALERVRLDGYPHRSLVWAGSADAAPFLGPLAAGHRTDNVLDGALRPRCGPLAETLGRLHLAGLTDPDALRPVTALAEPPVLATPEAVARSRWRRPGTPWAAVDVGGGTTDVHLWPAGGAGPEATGGAGPWVAGSTGPEVAGPTGSGPAGRAGPQVAGPAGPGPAGPAGPQVTSRAALGPAGRAGPQVAGPAGPGPAGRAGPQVAGPAGPGPAGRAGPGAARAGAAGAGAAASHHVFAGLGVAGDRRTLLDRLACAPYLDELVDAVAPEDRRAVYQRLRDGDEAALPARRAFLACLFTALRELASGPAAAGLRGAGGFTVTGGACRGAAPEAVWRTIGAACGRSDGSWTLVLDEAHDLWARGLVAPAAVR